jgi:hypothetical protein
MFKITKLMLCAGMAMAATAAKAADLPPEILNNVMQVCRPDYHRVCPDVLPGGGRVGRCLMDHERELSPSCLKAIKFAHAVEVCLPDYQRYCQGVRSGMEAVVQCLAGQMRSLSPECGEIVSANAPYVGPEGPRYSDGRYGPPYRDRYSERPSDYDRDMRRDPYSRPDPDRYANRDDDNGRAYDNRRGAGGDYGPNGQYRDRGGYPNEPGNGDDQEEE